MYKGNILVVDDTSDNLELLEGVLDEEGYDVRTAISGEMALTSVEAQMPDLILLDIMMPGIDGYETCRKIKQDPLSKEIPIIFLSAKGEVSDRLKGFDVGGVDYLTKPFDVLEVLARIKTHLRLFFLKRELDKKIKMIDEHVIFSATDSEGVITDASSAFCKISGYSKEELISKRHNILRDPLMPDELYSDLMKTIKQGKVWRGEIRNKSKSGEFYWVDVIIEPTFRSDGSVKAYTSVRHDITDKKKVELLAITDELTGLYNRRYFQEILPKEIKRSIRQDQYLSFVMMDLDYFKQYNDLYGHQLGDRVLVEMGKVLTKALQRAGDFVFRLGGEEFGIIYTTQGCEDSKRLTESVRLSVEALKIEHKGNKSSGFVTTSLGVVCIDFSQKKNHTMDIDRLYKLADEELYRAKEAGRNTLCMRML